MNIKNAALACAISVFSIGAAVAGPTNVPIKGTINFTGSMDPTIGTTACPIVGLNYGGGSLSHLGKSAMVSSDCVTPVGMTPIGPILAASDGKLTLTAANGDTVTGTYSGMFNPINNGAAYQFSNVTFGITGGTGRFQGAYGKGTLEGTQEILSGRGTITINGTISY